MREVEKILVPIDFSKESAKALRYALSLATDTTAELVALYVLDESTDLYGFIGSA
jgi:nucleotide-binding universal stress UspA family protein